MNITPPIAVQTRSAADVVRANAPSRQVPPSPVASAGSLSGVGPTTLSDPVKRGSDPELAITSQEDVAIRIKEIMREYRGKATTLQFDVDDNSQAIIVRVVNRTTGEVIRQIPPEDLLRLSQRLEDLQGVLFDQET